MLSCWKTTYITSPITLAPTKLIAMELTILMPCLNEAETLAICIGKAKGFLTRAGICGEVLVADNGSTDGSQEIAVSCGARVVNVSLQGYGAALQKGIESAYGTYVIMGDADDSYDFSNLKLFVNKLDEGNDLVIGNRFKGGIKPGAMPFLHKYLGNPVLSFIGRLFFKIPVGDFHCGLRGFNRARMLHLDLTTTGMEYASEMVVRCALANYFITEVPTTLSQDGRSRDPHLNTWRDGWRHLRFLLLFSPRWLFLYPSLSLLLIGGILGFLLVPGDLQINDGVNLGLHTFVMANFFILAGVQGLSFSIVSRRFAINRGFLPAKSLLARTSNIFTLERAIITAFFLLFFGFIGIIYSLYQWASVGFGDLEINWLIRLLIISGAAIVMGVQIIFTAFLAEVMEIKAVIHSEPKPSK